MASSSKRTKFLPFIFIAVLVLVIGGFLFITQVGIPDGEGKKQVFDMQSKRLKTVDADADTPIDTINTIAINSVDFKEKLQDVEESNFETKQRMQEMADMLKEMSKTNLLLKQQLEQQNRKMASVETAMNNSPKTIDAESIKASVMGVLQRNLPDMIKTSGIIESKTPSTEEGDYEISDKPIFQPETRTRIRSYNLPAYDPKDPKQRLSSPESNTQSGRKGSTSGYRGDNLSNLNPFKKPEEVVVDPRFTIPPDSSLFDSVTISVLRGRIPKDGDVSDPSPFKVAIGRDNLAANGFSMPGISGMIMSGTVYGDLVGRCVRTKILRATYIFEDGRILTLPKKKRNKGTAIGYIASPIGDPCIKGRYVSNGNAQQAKSILANMAAGAANAYAQTQVTSQTNNQGGASSVVTGSDKKFVVGSAISSGANSIADALAKQQFDQWDYIIVDVGETVTINIDTQLEIDNASNLRKISYENENANYGLTD